MRKEIHVAQQSKTINSEEQRTYMVIKLVNIGNYNIGEVISEDALNADISSCEIDVIIT